MTNEYDYRGDDLDEPDPEIRIIVTDMDGTVIDSIECTKADLVHEIKQNPHGPLSSINEKLLDNG